MRSNRCGLPGKVTAFRALCRVLHKNYSSYGPVDAPQKVNSNPGLCASGGKLPVAGNSSQLPGVHLINASRLAARGQGVAFNYGDIGWGESRVLFGAGHFFATGGLISYAKEAPTTPQQTVNGFGKRSSMQAAVHRQFVLRARPHIGACGRQEPAYNSIRREGNGTPLTRRHGWRGFESAASHLGMHYGSMATGRVGRGVYRGARIVGDAALLDHYVPTRAAHLYRAF